MRLQYREKNITAGTGTHKFCASENVIYTLISGNKYAMWNMQRIILQWLR